MLQFRCILVILAAVLLASLGACGQTGPLYLPQEPAAATRATLPQSLLPSSDEEPTAPTQPSTSEPTPATE